MVYLKCTYNVQMSGLNDENTIFLRWPCLRTLPKTASRKRLISKGKWHSLLPSFNIMSHFNSMLKPQFGSIVFKASSNVGKAWSSTLSSVNSYKKIIMLQLHKYSISFESWKSLHFIVRPFTPSWYIWNHWKYAPLYFCLPALVGTQSHHKQKHFMKSCCGFLMTAGTNKTWPS